MTWEPRNRMDDDENDLGSDDEHEKDDADDNVEEENISVGESCFLHLFLCFMSSVRSLRKMTRTQYYIGLFRWGFGDGALWC